MAAAPHDPDHGPLRVVDRATALLRVYTRAFLAQGAGLVGLAWCLAQDLPWVALGLTALLLVDQTIFLRGRPGLIGTTRLQAGLDLWCLVVSGVDLLILFAVSYRAAGLRDAGGTLVSDPQSCFAFAVATLARLDLGLVPVGGGGRLVAAVEALLGDAAVLAAVAMLVRAARRRAPGATRP